MEKLVVPEIAVAKSIDIELEDVYKTYQKWFYIEDTKRIDVALAVLINQKLGGLPLWLFLCGPSGDWKSTQISTLAIKGTLRIDKLTSRTLVSGQKHVENDLINDVWGKVILIYDFAEVMSRDKTEKNAIFAQWRNLYDGKAGGSYGTGKSVAYEGTPPQLIVGCTPAIYDEYLLSQELGTRELIYRVDTENTDASRKKAIELVKRGLCEQAICECKMFVGKFIASHKPTADIEIPKTVQDAIEVLTEELALFRANARIDPYSGELLSEPHMEIPTRASMQFIQLYKALRNLDDDYPNERAIEIIKNIVESSGDPITMKVYRCLQQSEEPLSTNSIARSLRLGYKTVYSRLNLLHALDAIDMTIDSEGDKKIKLWLKKADSN
jgi:predicted DNA-binding transcriptional regulator